MTAAPAFTPRPSRAALYSDPIDPTEIQTYSVAEVARMLGVGEQTLRRAIHNGTCSIKNHKVMGRFVFPKAAVHAALSAE